MKTFVFCVICLVVSICCCEGRGGPSRRTTSSPTFACDAKLPQYRSCSACLNTTDPRSWCYEQNYCFETASSHCQSNCQGLTLNVKDPVDVGQCKQLLTVKDLIILFVLLCSPCVIFGIIYGVALMCGYTLTRSGFTKRQYGGMTKVVSPTTSVNTSNSYAQVGTTAPVGYAPNDAQPQQPQYLQTPYYPTISNNNQNYAQYYPQPQQQYPAAPYYPQNGTQQQGVVQGVVVPQPQPQPYPQYEMAVVVGHVADSNIKY